MVMQFRGREMAYKDLGMAKFRDILSTVEKLGSAIESNPKMMGNRIITIVAPNKKPKQISFLHVEDSKTADDNDVKSDDQDE